jgi:hypothetical protein
VAKNKKKAVAEKVTAKKMGGAKTVKKITIIYCR